MAVDVDPRRNSSRLGVLAEMQTDIQWRGGMAFDVQTGSGHTLRVDGPPDLGGENSGPRPMELLLSSLGTCSAVDVVYILGRSRVEVEDCRVVVSGTRADTDPKVFTAIHLDFVLKGESLSEKLVDRAVKLSAEKYCSVARMIESNCELTHSWRIESDADPNRSTEA